MTARPASTDIDAERDVPVSWPLRVGAWLLALSLVAAAGWFVAQRYQRGQATPRAEVLAAAEAIIAEELQPKDAIAFLPAWSANERWRFERLWRARDLDYRAAWMPGEPVEAWDAEGFERLWLLTTHDANRGLPLAPLGRLLRNEELGGGVQLLLFRLPPSRTRYDMRLQIGDADVRRIGPKPGVEERCRPQGNKQRCSGPWWASIESGLHEVGNSRRRCLFIQPHPAGATLRLRYPDVPKGYEVAGRVGNRLWAVRYETGGDVRFSVRVGDAVRYSLIIPRGDFTWHHWRVLLRDEERGLPISLEFAAADPTWRQLCVDARVLGPPLAGAPAAP